MPLVPLTPVVIIGEVPGWVGEGCVFRSCWAGGGRRGGWRRKGETGSGRRRSVVNSSENLKQKERKASSWLG